MCRVNRHKFLLENDSNRVFRVPSNSSEKLFYEVHSYLKIRT
ncbi:hypothetical protein LEP1GSC161_3900 [Leptospira santarosai str. CBC1416]|uniref:Uncharacterized protein n=1 Tax=Leptospira santarosai str. CBC1416 TaxID=1193059 RepID=M6VLT4_9LEPT|nr:hypothetical protein LEP1GSC068_0590 [Leptospira sp. Fiocruz LV3954]EMO57805.1 hypothetical protein LEP1GSC161_3900 [Leptospira santarosai str. CBC1416]EMO71673.1 hypothetical protein LEP1GSC130_1812 [Leptospira santarosai str. 200403458]EMO82962.1 hypothetical protein LEP1GSC070_1443 [Leptospira santarosai str. AIM]EMP02409.1 hypothetical protein LEP1GSC171_0226 [Leptospira santarosai str. HAI1380]